jgi:hypothetical protein
MTPYIEISNNEIMNNLKFVNVEANGLAFIK